MKPSEYAKYLVGVIKIANCRNKELRDLLHKLVIGNTPILTLESRIKMTRKSDNRTYYTHTFSFFNKEYIRDNGPFHSKMSLVIEDTQFGGLGIKLEAEARTESGGRTNYITDMSLDEHGNSNAY